MIQIPEPAQFTDVWELQGEAARLGTRLSQLGRWLGPAFFLALLLYALWPFIPFPGRETPAQSLVVYGFSILEGAMVEGIFPAFQRHYFEETGRRVEPIGSFAGSGVITSQIVMGAPAQIAILATELDAIRLVEGGRTQPFSWRELPFEGTVNRTPFVILVRQGNPKNIHSFDDLTRPGVELVHPDPLTSGGALWAVLAEYGVGLREGGPERGYELLLGVWRNVVARASSARSARTQFEQGFGDALVTYEQEALAQDEKRPGEVVTPPSTILAEHTAVPIRTQITPQNRDLVDAFLAFLWSEEAQQIFVEHGFRSVLPELQPAAGSSSGEHSQRRGDGSGGGRSQERAENQEDEESEPRIEDRSQERSEVRTENRSHGRVEDRSRERSADRQKERPNDRPNDHPDAHPNDRPEAPEGHSEAHPEDHPHELPEDRKAASELGAGAGGAGRGEAQSKVQGKAQVKEAEIADAFTVEDLGGWPKAYEEIVQKVWMERVLKELER